MEFGPKFFEILKRHGVSQKKFAEDCNLNRAYVSRVLNGENASASFIFSAVNYFPDLDLKYLFAVENPATINKQENNYTEKERSANLIKDIEVKLHELKLIVAQY